MGFFLSTTRFCTIARRDSLNRERMGHLAETRVPGICGLAVTRRVSKLLSGSGQPDEVSADFPEPGCHVRIVDRSVGGLELLVGEELARDPVYFG